MMVTLKPGATCKRPAPAGFRLLREIDTAAEALGIPLLITSGDEPRGRKSTDPHMTGEAYDLSVRGLPPDQIVQLYRLLQGLLRVDQFTVLFECATAPSEPELVSIAYLNPKATGRHLHLQRKKGTVWAPVPRPLPGVQT
jgi:hypothetical protein